EKENTPMNFLFDFLATNLELFTSKVLEPINISMELKIFKEKITITSSRINVNEFVNNRQTTVNTTISELRRLLGENGLVVTVRYIRSTLGSGVMKFPDTILDQISPNMRDLLCPLTIKLINGDDHIGNATMLVMLLSKCEVILEMPAPEEEEPPDPEPKAVEEKPDPSTLGTTFNVQDILFVVGDPDPVLKVPSQPCSELPSQEGDERLQLDMARYKSLKNRRVKFPADDPCPRDKPSFTQLKMLTQHYANIIDTVSKKIQNIEWPSVRTPEKKLSPRTSHQEINEQRWIDIPIRSKDDHGIEPIRFCPVCLHSMSWMPKYSPCPNCLSKVRPVLEGHSPKQMTAEEIMEEQLKKPKRPPGADDFCTNPCEQKMRANENGSDEECPPCRCTCKKGAMCAHCRIRAMCEEVYHSESHGQCNLCPEPNTDEDFCIITDSQDDNRPYLLKVFSEMKDLYRLHDTKKKNVMQKRSKSTSSMHGDTRIPGIPETFRATTGHKECIPDETIVPHNHGWDWRKSYKARKQGWRPGAILRSAGHVMRFFRMRQFQKNICKKATQAQNKRDRCPVLNVCKKFGEIYVTLRPLPTSKLQQHPIIFRIVKSDLASALREIKQALKKQGFRKCTCHKSLMMCVCRDAIEKVDLNKALKKECQKRLMEPCPEHLVLTDTSESEMEFDIDVNPPRRSKKQIRRTTTNHITQTTMITKDRQVDPIYPVEHSPYHRDVDCAAGGRYLGTVLGSDMENVFEDGVFGLQGGGPHGANPLYCNKPRLAAAWGNGGPSDAMFGGGRGQRSGPGAFGGAAMAGAPGANKLFKKPGRPGPFPVRYPDRFLKPGRDAVEAAKQAELDAIAKKKAGPDMIKYLEKEGTLKRPWNPDEGKDMRPKKPKYGADGLTDAERKIKALLNNPPPPLCCIPRRGKGLRPCDHFCRNSCCN
ncbi:hypothetical protein KR018_007536, partial [Drosophila ironensis]